MNLMGMHFSLNSPEEAFTIESVVDGIVDERIKYPHRFVTYRRKAAK